MGKEVTIVIFKPSTQTTEEYIVVVNPDEYKKYKDGDTSVALALIVDSFDVFHSSTGHTGKWGKASKQQLETAFGTARDDDVIKQILDKGVSKSSEAFATRLSGTNTSRGSGDVKPSTSGSR